MVLPSCLCRMSFVTTWPYNQTNVFDVEVEDGTIIFKRLEAGYDIDQ